jgi:hypothetical protein
LLREGPVIYFSSCYARFRIRHAAKPASPDTIKLSDAGSGTPFTGGAPVLPNRRFSNIIPLLFVPVDATLSHVLVGNDENATWSNILIAHHNRSQVYAQHQRLGGAAQC